jgi:hypothetical protein
MPDEVQFAIDQISRVLESMGWKVVAMDIATPNVILTIQKPKEVILKPV